MKKYTVFIASPSDVKKERQLLPKVIEEINLTHGAPLGYELNLWNYEKNAHPSASKPQDLINDIVEPYQIFIGVMWNRFGTPTTTAGSGTEEEYNIAYEAWKKKEVIDILFYFCKKPAVITNLEDHEQLGKVIQFKDTMNGKSFTWDYDNPKDFKEKIRKHLCLLMSKVIKKENNPNMPKTNPNEETDKLFKEVWHKMTPELQRYLTIPYNENRMRGDGGIKTEDLFAAMVTNPSLELQSIMKHIPSKALPSPIEGKIVNENYIIHEKPWLSHCISSSIRRLNKALAPEEQITATDIFIDIAKNGTGQSVRLLREHKITTEKIDHILIQEKLNVLRG